MINVTLIDQNQVVIASVIFESLPVVGDQVTYSLRGGNVAVGDVTRISHDFIEVSSYPPAPHRARVFLKLHEQPAIKADRGSLKNQTGNPGKLPKAV